MGNPVCVHFIHTVQRGHDVVTQATEVSCKI
jgi:hypothetical protein